jgi:hypothetical protein
MSTRPVKIYRHPRGVHVVIDDVVGIPNTDPTFCLVDAVDTQEYVFETREHMLATHPFEHVGIQRTVCLCGIPTRISYMLVSVHGLNTAGIVRYHTWH